MGAALDALAIAAALGCALIAGVFYAFSTFVMRALALVEPPAGIAAMQSINRVVINPWFLGPFFGAGLLAVAAAGVALSRASGAAAACALAGAALYVFGTLGVTIRCNVPRNNALARLAAAEATSRDPWARYVAEWTFWNHVRTAAAFAAAALFTLSPLA